jgi:hypothetical protein
MTLGNWKKTCSEHGIRMWNTEYSPLAKPGRDRNTWGQEAHKKTSS